RPDLHASARGNHHRCPDRGQHRIAGKEADKTLSWCLGAGPTRRNTGKAARVEVWQHSTGIECETQASCKRGFARCTAAGARMNADLVSQFHQRIASDVWTALSQVNVVRHFAGGQRSLLDGVKSVLSRCFDASLLNQT